MKLNKKLNLLLIFVLLLSFIIPSYANNVDIEYLGKSKVTIQGTSDYTQKPATLTVYDRDQSVYEYQNFTDIHGKYSFTITVDGGKLYTGKVKIEGEVQEFSFATKGEKEYQFGEEVKPSNDSILFFQDGIYLNLKNSDIQENSRVQINEKNISVSNGLKKAGKTVELKFKGISLDKIFEIGISTDSANKDKVSLYAYDVSDKRWKYINSNKINNVVSAQINTDGIYGVFEDTESPKDVELQLKENNGKRVSLSLFAKDSSEIKIYEIYRDNKLIGHSNNDTYVDTKIEPKQNYKYKIKAIDSLGNVSDFSKELEVVVKESQGNIDENKKVNVSIRIEGYEKIVLYDDNLEVGVFDLDPYLTKSTHPTATPSNGWPKERFSGPTVAHAFVQALKNKNIDDYNFEDYGWSCYISRIGKDKEFKYKHSSGWMYRVNGWLPDYGVENYKLKDGDKIEIFFGVNGFLTWFTKISADKTTIAPGEEVALTLDGEITILKDKNKRGPTYQKLIEGAKIYVNHKPYEMDGKIVTTDQNGKGIIKFDKPGTYTIGAEKVDKEGYVDIVRPIPIEITVSGKAQTGSTRGGGGGPIKVDNPEYNKEQNVVNDKNATEKDVTNAVKDATNKLEKTSKEIKSEKDANHLIKDAKDVSNIIGKALEKINTENAAKDVANKSNEVLKMITLSSEKLTKVEDKKEASKVAVKDMNNTLEAMDQINDAKEISKVAVDMIDIAGKLIKNIGQDQGTEIKKHAIKAAEKAVQKAGIKEIKKEQLKVEGDKVILELNKNEINTLAKDIVQITKDMKGKLSNNHIEISKSLEKKLTLQIPKMNQKEIETSLPDTFIKDMREIGMEKVQINTEITEIEMKKGTFNDQATEKELVFNVKKLEVNELLALQKNKVPQNSIVVDVNIKAGDKKITAFEQPIKLYIPYKGDIKNGEVVQAFYLKDNGIIENMGGVYDPVTKMVTFETTHFSKYFANKVEKTEIKSTFNDLIGYEWAKEAIEEMAQKGIISGRSEDVFDPSASITRAEFATLITKMLGLNIENEKVSFTDIEDTAWYTPYVKTAYKNGFVRGRSETIFDPNGKITREEMTTIIGKVLIQKGKEKANINELERFNDKTNIASWANEKVALCVKESMIRGMPDGTFMPKQNANRAQAAVMLNQLYHNIQ
ncbi:S-layer homology domain-containing protein [Inediibacterium massiliense]|uniref:S-layer homology domain-containing protein n=1 Tax=Inediibacterium massiliense TaxID=1658111 RepID=UPI0006B60D4F|nr:S-layer homology domain-containing protein [Inediibacterium massiliense]